MSHKIFDTTLPEEHGHLDQ